MALLFSPLQRRVSVGRGNITPEAQPLDRRPTGATPRSAGSTREQNRAVLFPWEVARCLRLPGKVSDAVGISLGPLNASLGKTKLSAATSKALSTPGEREGSSTSTFGTPLLPGPGDP